MAVSAIESYQASLNAKAGSASAISGVQDRFLTLLVTQLKNQDPMNPMENAELTTQLAQMSTVEGINKLNAGFEALLGSYQASQTLQAAALVDRVVLVEGNRLALGENGAGGRVDLAAPADRVVVRVTDADGALVRALELGPQPAGALDFVWDGQDAAGNALEPGEYRYEAEALRGNEGVDVTTYALGQVTSVALSGGSAKVDVAGLGTRDIAEILRIY